MSTQAIIKQTYTTVLTFAGVPSKETRDELTKRGFSFDGKSSQWVRSQKAADVIAEENVATALAA